MAPWGIAATMRGRWGPGENRGHVVPDWPRGGSVDGGFRQRYAVEAEAARADTPRGALRGEGTQDVTRVARPATDEDVALLFARREAPIADLARHAGAVGRICYAMACRFQRGGKLVVFGTGSECTDALHVAVEFVHPVIVGKRALPAVALTADVATVTGLAARAGVAGVFAHQVALVGEPADIALGISADGDSVSVLRGLEAARDLGMLTVALAGGEGGAIETSPAVDHVLAVRSSDPRIVKEVHVTTYHLLWELVHVFFEQPGTGAGVIA